MLCTVLTYPPAWSWVVLPGFSCKPAPPRAGGAVTTGYIFQNISVEINCGQLLTDVLINPGLRQYKFGHFVLGEFPLWLVAEHLKYGLNPRTPRRGVQSEKVSSVKGGVMAGGENNGAGALC